MTRTELVGRKRELAALTGWLTAAFDGDPRLVLCGGEPGVGKTRLAEELADLARDRGVPAVWGRTAEADGAPPYWPWRQILRAASEVTDAALIADRLGVAPDLVVVAPEAFPHVAARPTGDEAGTEQRFRLFDGCSCWPPTATPSRCSDRSWPS